MGAHGATADADIVLARRIMRTCVRMYTESPSGLAAEIAEFNHPSRVLAAPGARHTLLRPETVESLFVLWRLTGDRAYREDGWRIFEAFEAHARVPSGGYAPVRDVTLRPPKLERRGKMESFFTAETLKYLYLLFGDGAQYPLDEYVFNTEAHPLRIRPEYAWGAEWGSLPTLADLAAQQYEAERRRAGQRNDGPTRRRRERRWRRGWVRRRRRRSARRAPRRRRPRAFGRTRQRGRRSSPACPSSKRFDDARSAPWARGTGTRTQDGGRSSLEWWPPNPAPRPLAIFILFEGAAVSVCV